jgi:hypothetical protein
MKYRDCPVCTERTVYYSTMTPDEVWAWKASLLIQKEKEAEQEESADEIPTIDVKITTREGKMWAGSWEVYRRLYRRLDEGDLFRVGDQVFEVVWYIHPRREYLVRGFSERLSEDDLRKLAGP